MCDIACPSPGTCVAISFDGSVAAITDGTAGPAQLVSPDVILSSIACTDASHCVAVGAYIQGGSLEGAVVAIADGVPGPYQAVPGMDVLQTVACSTSCVAVGDYNNFGAIVPISQGVPRSAQYADGAGLLWDVACGALMLNEQVPGPTGGLTVNGIHLSVNGGGLAQANLVVGSARSGIGNCP